MQLLNRFLVYLFENQYCESDFAYIILLFIILYVGWTFMEGVMAELQEITYQQELLKEDD